LKETGDIDRLMHLMQQCHTGGWSPFQIRRFSQRLFDLALLAEYRREPDQLVLHDVIHAYLRKQTHHPPAGAVGADNLGYRHTKQPEMETQVRMHLNPTVAKGRP
jgi:hypothetical protein